MEVDKYHLTEQLAAEESQEELPKVDQVILGYVSGLDSRGQAEVSFVYRGNRYQYPALTSGANGVEQGRQVALSFISGLVSQPIILGAVYSPLADMLDNIELSPAIDEQQQEAGDSQAQDLLEQPVKVDGKRVSIEGAEQVELKCGDASITLTKAGKILIRGKYLLNRASGVNRIVGGSVQVN